MHDQMSAGDQEDLTAKAMARAENLFSNDPELRALIVDSDLSETANAAELPVEQSIDILFEGYSERPALGTRDYTIEKDQSGRSKKQHLPGFKMTTFGELRHQIRAIASAWSNEADIAVKRDEFILYIGFASAQYAAIDYASAYCQAVSVPLQSAAGRGELETIVTNTNPVAIAATLADLVVAAWLAAGHPGVRSLIVFDYDDRDDDEREQFETALQILETAGSKTRLVTFQQLIEKGEKYAWEFLPTHPDGQNRLATLMHSSGATGVPKGAMLDERIMKQHWNATGAQRPGISVTFAPFNHGMGRYFTIWSLKLGCPVYFTLMPDMSSLFEDIRLARPTMLVFFPAFWNWSISTIRPKWESVFEQARMRLLQLPRFETRWVTFFLVIA